MDKREAPGTPEIPPVKNTGSNTTSGRPASFEPQVGDRSGAVSSNSHRKKKSTSAKQRANRKNQCTVNVTGKGGKGLKKKTAEVIVVSRKAVLEVTPKVELKGNQNVPVCSRWLNGDCPHGHLCFFRHEHLL